MLPTPEVRKNDLVYEPYEDSYFLMDCLEMDKEYLNRLEIPLVLEIGSGSGVVSTFLNQLKPKGIFFATDVNLNACESTRDTWAINKTYGQIDTLNADLFPLRNNTVDLLIMNPPYVPSEKLPSLPKEKDSSDWLDLALDGGVDGMELTNRVLDGLDSFLTESGVAYILFCARNHPEQISKRLEQQNWDVTHILTRKVGYEILTVLRFTKSPS